MRDTKKGKQTKMGQRSHVANLQATAAGLPTVEEVARYLGAVEDLLAWAPLQTSPSHRLERSHRQVAPLVSTVTG